MQLTKAMKYAKGNNIEGTFQFERVSKLFLRGMIACLLKQSV